MENSERLDEAAPSPGDQLRNAREALGISRREMADRLNWMPAYVNAIEENRFEELRGAAFIRGYLRAYAKQVALPEEDLMAAYAAHCGAQPPVEKKGKRMESRIPQVQKKGIAIPAGTAIAVLLVFMLWYWRGDEQQANGTPVPAGGEFGEIDAPQQAEALVQEQSIPLLVVPGEQAASPETEEPPGSATASEALDSVGVDSTGLPSSTTVADATGGVAPGGEAGETAEEAAEVAGADPEMAAAESTVLVPDPVATTSEPAGGPNIITVDATEPGGGAESGQLQFRFSGDCWLEVRNAAGDLIYADLRRAGDVLELAGEAPFELLLGDARVVELDYQGEPVTIRRRPGRTVAKFSVGEQ
jgi:cytoskeleton protein RodZ